jgi:hypothetical protein
MEATRGAPEDDTAMNGCDECGANFPTAEALERHQNLAHPNGPGRGFDRARAPPAEPVESPETENLRPDESEMSDQRSSPAEREPEMVEGSEPMNEGADEESDLPHGPQPPHRDPMPDERPAIEHRNHDPSQPGHTSRGPANSREPPEGEPSEMPNPEDAKTATEKERPRKSNDRRAEHRPALRDEPKRD